MPLLAAEDQKVRAHFHELIDEGEQLLKIFDKQSEDQYRIYEAWCVKASSLVLLLYGKSGKAEKYQEILERIWPLGYSFVGFTRKAILAKLSTLSGLNHNYENGFLDSLHDRAVTNISADYMEQAEAMLGEGIEGQYDHVPAAVLCGAVLENRLRGYCENHDPRLPTTKPNGDSKTLGALIEELDKAKAFDKQTRKMLKAWADIRNAAAHGRFDEFTREQVELMLLGVNGFLANQL